FQKGSKAVIFNGTVEFRKMQFELFHRGDGEKLDAQTRAANHYKAVAFDMLDNFSKGIDTQEQQEEAKKIFREIKKQLRNRVDAGLLEKTQADDICQISRTLRNRLLAAYQASDNAAASKSLEDIFKIIDSQQSKELKNTLAKKYLDAAESYRETLAGVNLSMRDKYAESLGEVKESLRLLLGPRLDEPRPQLAQDRFGATRWDMAVRELHHFLYTTQWISDAPGQPMHKVEIPREEFFKGTSLASLFPYVKDNLHQMLLPEKTFYWQYFIDDSTPGHYFGGVGPEMLGTLLITVLSIMVAFPLGVIAAAYLAQCNNDSTIIRFIRICINTLAGVPSIVFGLFGLAFFVQWLQPKLGLAPQASILAGSLTLAVLVMPVIIRASEEAIRSVPRTYREASMGLGAGEFRTFMTVTLPSALPGILTGVILSMSRAAGETAPILFCAAVALGPIPNSLMSPTRTLSYGSYDIAVGDRLAMLVPHQQFGMVMSLVLLVLILNIVAIAIRWRVSRKLRGM
ncbi:MAG TPA: phosphate ABC transporter permease PstA, partial [Phycisphaerae bacterium]|nr:phosphate ABC transporter permease PstA [Phycisphaerae bacterium]